MAMEKDPSRPFLVLGDIAQDFGYIADREGFRMVMCRRQEAYGCGENGDAIVRGLALLVRLGREDDPYISPKLCISASEEVFVRVGSEIDDRKAKLFGRHLRLSAYIYAVDGNVMVLRVSFVASFRSADFRTYYLVYYSAAASLSLLPRMPPCCQHACTKFPLVLKGEEEAKYSLVLMAERAVCTSAKHTDPVLCLWSPPPPSPDNDSNRSWDLKARVRVNALPNPFKANVVFLFKGNAVWGDLAQGILYCNCGGPEPVDFKHIMLPEECRISAEDMDLMDHCSLCVHRTMGCVGDSIWFVIIEPNFTCPGDTMVKVWTLDLLSEDEKWKPHTEFSMLDLFRAAEGHPAETVPKFPMVTREADCALYMLLPEPYGGDVKAYDGLVCIDLRNSCEARLQSNRRLAIPLMQHPVFLYQDFFNSLGHYY